MNFSINHPDGLTPIYVEGLEFLIELCLMHNDRRVTV